MAMGTTALPPTYVSPSLPIYKDEMYQFPFPPNAVQNLPVFLGGQDFKYSGTEMKNNFWTPSVWQETALTSELQ